MGDRIFGVDGNFYLHRVVHTQVFEPKDEQLSQAQRLLGMICKDAAAVRANRILVGFDGWAIFRYKLYAGYKSNRDGSGSSDVYTHLDFIKDHLGFAGIPVVHRAQYEADDLMCSLATQNDNVVIGCRDKDAYQYVRPGIVLYDSSAKPEPVRIDEEWIRREFGLKPKQLLDYQTLIGDSIDCVPQLMKKANALEGLQKHGSIVAWAKADREGMGRWVTAKRDKLVLNRRLVRLKPDVEIDVPPIKWSSDQKFTKSYHQFRAFAGSKTRRLF